MTAGYYRFPTIHQDTIVFVSEDDLWRVAAQGGVARRLTSNVGEVTYPMLSPDGRYVAFVGREEGGSEVYVMEAEGGSARRLTYLNSNCQVLGWMADGNRIIFSSTYGQMDRREMGLFTVAMDALNGTMSPLSYGPARSIAFGPGGAVVLGRNTGDPARWKRYRGGTAGHLWIDANGDGEFQRFLAHLPGNIASPMWLAVHGEPRVFFVSDHEGIGNLYSARPDGGDVQRHTDHEVYYARNPSSDGRSIIYHVGADLFVFYPEQDREARVEVAYHSPRVQRNRKFVDAGRYLDGFDLHPSGLAVAITSRGKAFGFFNHEGAVLQYGKRDGVRYRRPEWLCDGRRFVVVTDEPGEETLEIFGPEPYADSQRLDGLDLGRVAAVKASPVEKKLAITNHRYELLIVDIETSQVTVVDRSAYRSIEGFDWSPDGRWLAYSFGASSQTSEIRLYRLAQPTTSDEDGPDGDAKEVAAPEQKDQADKNGAAGDDGEARIFTVTEPVLHDVRPAFDPEGKYLYFLSYREFNPVNDALHFDLSFPWGMRPYLLTLRANLPNPFVPRPDFGEVQDDGDDETDDDDEASDSEDEDSEDEYADEGPEDEDSEDEEDEYDDDDDAYGEDEDGGASRGFAWRGTGFGRQRRRRRRRRAGQQGRRLGRGYRSEDDSTDAQNGDAASKGAENDSANGTKTRQKDAASRKAKVKPIRIDLDGIQQRVVAFPVPDARYGQVAGIRGKAIFTVFPVFGQLDNEHSWDDEEPETGQLRAYDFKDYKNELLADHVAAFDLSANGKKLIYSSGRQLRVINAGEKPPSGGPPRKTGWIQSNRVKVSIDPQTEWQQMFREAWRLQRDQFWTADMSQVDWQTVFVRYFDLIPRVSTRSEFSDLLWEMQGELGTSHAYEFGGDYRPRPYYGQGFLGAEFVWDETYQGYRVEKILYGDPWNPEAHSPLASSGQDVRVGDILVNVNGQRLDADTGPAQLLVNQARNEVLLVFMRPSEDAAGSLQPEQANGTPAGQGAGSDENEAENEAEAESVEPTTPTEVPVENRLLGQAEAAADVIDEAGDAANGEVMHNGESSAPDSNGKRKKPRFRSIVLRAMGSETQARYRQWVNENRQRVHAATDGRIGYVHIPDMSALGYAEFHRGYLAEVDRDGLIVDVRYNGGGHVSQLILEKLGRRRIGYDLSRWGGLIPYPMESVAGPLVALTNEQAASDGDIFCHSFKLMKLGPLIGKRTWGGVIGISPHHALVDGTVTTQPEYSFWFEDVGWNVENYGTDPDIEVDNRPQDYRAGLDAQLERAIQEALRLLDESPVRRPAFDQRPNRALPKLPPRTTAQHT